MHYIFKIILTFVLSLFLIFTLVACKGNKEPADSGSDNVSGSNGVSSIVTGSTDNGNNSDDAHLDINDIFGSSESSGSSSEESSSSEPSSSSKPSNSSEPSSSSESSGSSEESSSSGIDYDDPGVWTDPV
ncbi:MAG: hypothetical protein E7565_01270 [Ruminococcaceae bacterium]|nr:hypothetical protein [Oscillospiraceae bacterium]